MSLHGQRPTQQGTANTANGRVMADPTNARYRQGDGIPTNARVMAYPTNARVMADPG